MKSNPLSLEHAVLRALSQIKVGGGRWLMAVSGGVDSMVMLTIISKWARYLKIEVGVAHVHHGYGASKAQNRFRDECQGMLQEWCAQRKIAFFTNTPVKTNATSESEFRKIRQQKIITWMRDGSYTHVVFAHHGDDLLETRLIRLIRGTGSQGLKAMAIRRGRVLRPMIAFTRDEIERYARSAKVGWCEDPSNALPMTLRNWLRHSWLSELEKTRPGAKKALARSLDLLVKDQFVETIGPFVGLRRESLSTLPRASRLEVLARYLRTLGSANYSRTHAEELAKRLQSNRHCEFTMLGWTFRTTKDFVWASRVESAPPA